MEGPGRSGGFRQSRRSRSQRDRERRRRRTERAAASLSSGSDREGPGNSLLGPGAREPRPGHHRHRPPRRRKRESVSCEEDIIDSFAIASFISLEALEMDCSLKPSQRSDLLGRRSKGKRGPEENGRGPLSEPEEGAPHSYSSSCWNKRSSKRRKVEGHPLETGYICDTESDTGDKVSDNDMDPVFTVSTRKVVDSAPSTMASSVGRSSSPVAGRRAGGGASRLLVTPRVSGLERSQEKNLEPLFPEPLFSSSSSSSSSSTSSRLPPHAAAAAARSSPINGTAGRHNGSSPPLSKPKAFLLTLSGRQHALYSRSGTPVKPSSSSAAASSSSSMRPPTPSTSVSLPYMRGAASTGPLRPPSRAGGSGALFTPSPGLPPPPPLLQGPAHSAEREGRRSVPEGSPAAAAASGAGRSTPGGPASSSASGSGSSGRNSQNQPSIPPLAFQFHQHNHQHQHTHTHQHFTPFLHPTATAPPLFEKFAGKMEGLYRHPFFPQYPPPSVPSIQPVIPPSGPFSSLQGAFQPKPLVPQGNPPDISARLGVVPPHHLQPKDPRLTDPFGTSLKVSNKPGKWCAMHVHVAWMILSHQKKVKLMQADPHKLDFRSDLLARFPGAGLGPLGPMGGALPPSHDLSRPPGLFSASGAVNPSSAPFMSPSTPHSSFLTPNAHLDPYGRSPPFTPLGALGSGAFGGLGSPTLASSVFGPKDSPGGGVSSLATPNHHDHWNRLHGAPPTFPAGPSWSKGSDKREERGKEGERRDGPHIKDEKDRDSLLYGRPPVRMSPLGSASFKPGGSSSLSQLNGHSSSVGGGGGALEDLTRSVHRDGDKRLGGGVSSRGPPLGASSSTAERDRPRSSSSSVLTTPPPSTRSAQSPLDLYPRPLGAGPLPLHTEPPHASRDGAPPPSSGPPQAKKVERTVTPQSKPPLLLPPVKVKEERKEEPEHIPISLPPPGPAFDRPSSHPHNHSSGTPSSSLSLTPTPGMALPPPAANGPAPQHLSLLDRSRAIEAYLGGPAGAGGLVVAPGGERFGHAPPQGPSQGPHSFTWDPWRELAAQQQQQRREALSLRPDPHLAMRSDPHLAIRSDPHLAIRTDPHLALRADPHLAIRSDPHLAIRSDPHLALRSDPHLALRSDPHLARLLQHQRLLEAERVAAMAAAVAASPHHPPTSTSSAAGRPDFGLMAHPFERPPLGGGLMDEEQRAQILREDYERVRYFGVHPHLPATHLSGPSHPAAHLEQLHPSLLTLPHGGHAPQHAGLYARLGTLNPHHVPNGLLAKTPSGLVGALAVGAPPPLIPSVSGRAATPPRGPRLGGASELGLYAAHKDGESR